MNFQGIILGIVSFLCIGLFHPIVIKAEYHYSCKIWPVFLLAGLFSLYISTIFENVLISATIGVIGFSCLWSIIELKEQEERVNKGWFPANPNRK